MRQVLAFVVVLSVINIGILIWQVWPESSGPRMSQQEIRDIYRQREQAERQYDFERRFNQLEQKQQADREWNEFQRNLDKWIGE